MAFTKPSSTQTTFSLFNDLLPELRLKVYEFALVTPEPLSFVDKDYFYQGEISPWNLSIFHGVALLRSSWKVYKEALPVFYAVNQFQFHILGKWTSCSTDLSNHIAMIRHITVGALFPKCWLDDLCASDLNELLSRFPQLHSFAFFFLRTTQGRHCHH